MVRITEIPKGNYISFIHNLPNQVIIEDPQLRRWVCAVAYANGKKIEVVKNVNKN